MRAEAERVGSQVAAKREHEAQLHAQADQYEAARNSAVSRFQDLEGQILVLEKALDAKERPQGPQRRFPQSSYCMCRFPLIPGLSKGLYFFVLKGPEP